VANRTSPIRVSSGSSGVGSSRPRLFISPSPSADRPWVLSEFTVAQRDGAARGSAEGRLLGNVQNGQPNKFLIVPDPRIAIMWLCAVQQRRAFLPQRRTPSVIWRGFR
jgi:hypothetical protein